MANALKTQEILLEAIQQIEQSNPSQGWLHTLFFSFWSTLPNNSGDIHIKRKSISHLSFSNTQLGKIFDASFDTRFIITFPANNVFNF